MALKIIKTSDLEEILTCNDESFLTITQKISEDNFISNKMQIKNLPLNNYYKKADIDELLKTYSKTTHNHDFNSLSNLPTTLSGYGITDVYTKTEIQDNTLNKIKATSGDFLVDLGFSIKNSGYEFLGINTGSSGAPTVKFGLSYDSDMYSHIDSYLGKLDLIASNQIYIRTPYLNLKVPIFRLSGSNGSFSVDVSDNKENNKFYASIPAEFTDIVKAPRINIYSNNNTVLEGALWNSTYNINGAIKDGLHLSHENGKYLALTYKNASTDIYDPYMIFDVEGVLKNDSDGDNWGPIRFEQNVFFKHGLKIGGGEDIILAGKGVNTRITALENVVSQGTGMVEWNNILNKPNTFTPSSHNHAISDITSLQSTLDGKASSTHNHDSVYVKQDGSTPITSRQQLKMGSYVFEAHAGNGTEGYALVAEFKILRNYQNTPIKIELARRGVLYSNITIQFRNTDSPDPTLQNFVYEGSDCMAYMVKADTSTWNLYIRKTEGYDVIFITKYSNPNSAITTTWKESVVTSLPDGGTYATPLQHAISEITDLQTTLDSKMSKIYDNKITGAISLDFKKQIVGTASNGGFVSSFRKDDSTDDCMPKYGAGLAWGQVDTHGMLCVDYNNPTAYVAGGNSNKLNWYKQIAWKDDLTNYSLKTHNHDTVYSKLGHTHNYAGSSTAGGPATSAITAKYPGVIWTATTQVGTWSALCKTTAYVSFILSISMNQNSQCGYDTFLVSTGWESARIYQLGGNGYTDNSGYKLRLVKESGTQYTLEIKNDYGYNGAKTLDIECRYIVTSNHDNITTYSKKFVASTNNAVIYSITTSPSGNILTDSINFSNLDSGTRGIGGTIGGSDYWRLVGGASTLDEGFVELATADNGTEPIMVSQYTGKFVTRTRRMYLLDSNGNTIIPGHLELENMKQILGKDTSGAYINLITMDKYNRVNIGDPKKCNSVLLAAKSAQITAYDGSQHYTVYHSGNFNPSNYLPLSGGNLTGDIALDGSSEQRIIFNNCSKSKLQTYFYKGNSTDSLTIIGLWDPTHKEPIWKVNEDWTVDIGKQTAFSKKVILNNTIQMTGRTTTGNEKTMCVVGADNAMYLSDPNIHTYIRSSDCPQYLDSKGNKYNIYHSGNFNPNNYFSRSGQNTTNLNTCYDVGIYYYTDSTTGAPNRQYGHILNTVSSGNKYNGSNNWLSQLAFNTDDTIWHRSKVNSGGWTNWTKLVKTTDLNNYLPKSGGTMTGALALTQDKGIVSANSEGGTLLVETSSSVNVGKTNKAVNLNCSAGSVNGSMILTAANYMYYMKNIFYILFERNNGTINKNINTCFNRGTFTAPEAGQYLVMCSGYRLSNSNMYVACVVGGENSNRNKLYTTGSSGFTLITLSAKQTLSIYECPAGNINNTCISSMSYVNMLIARIK